MFYIIGYADPTDEKLLRVIDTEDKVVTDITEEELVIMMLGGTNIENAELLGNKLVGKEFGLDRYGSTGEDNVFVILKEDKGVYEICNQQGEYCTVGGSELIRVALEYEIANGKMRTIKLPKGYSNYIDRKDDCAVSLGKFKVYIDINSDNKVGCEVIADNLSNYFLEFEHEGLDFKLLLKRCNGIYGNYLYYFGVIESYEEIGELWGEVDTQGFGIEPYIVVLVDYNIRQDKFTKGVLLVNADRLGVYNLGFKSRSNISIPCKCINEDDTINKYTAELDLVKNKLRFT